MNHSYVTSTSGRRGSGKPLRAPDHEPGTPVLVVWGFDSAGTFTLTPGAEAVTTSGSGATEERPRPGT